MLPSEVISTLLNWATVVLAHLAGETPDGNGSLDGGEPSNSSHFFVEEIRPPVLDFGRGGQLLSVSIGNTSNGNVHSMQCYLNGTNHVSLSVINDSENKALMRVIGRLLTNKPFTLHCALNGTEFESKQLVYVTSYSLLVQHRTVLHVAFSQHEANKVVDVTFTEPIDSDKDDPYCLFVRGRKIKRRFEATKITSVQYQCDVSPMDAIGVHSMILVRFSALRRSTFKYQIPIAVTISADNNGTSTSIATPSTAWTTPASTATSTTESSSTEHTTTVASTTAPYKPNDFLKSAIFGDSLCYMDVQLEDGVAVSGVDDCLDLFLQNESFGVGATCCVHGDMITVNLGKNATIVPHRLLEVRGNTLALAGHPEGYSGRENCSDNSTAGPLQIPIRRPLQPVSPSVTISSTGPAVACDRSVNVTVVSLSGVGGRTVVFRWIAEGEADSRLTRFLGRKTTRSIVIPRQLIRRSFILCCVVCSFVDVCAKSNALRVETSNRTEQMSLTVYNWTANGEEICSEDVCQIQPFAFKAGQDVVIHVTAYDNDTDGENHIIATSFHNFSVKVEPLSIVADSWDRSVSSDQPIVIDASATRDPNSPTASVQHHWTCLLNGSECQMCGVWEVDWDSPVLVIPAFALPPAVYLFMDDVTSGRLNGTAKVQVKVLLSPVPSITLLDLSQQRPNIDQYVRVIAMVEPKSWPLRYSWTMRRHDNLSYVNLSSAFPDASGEISEPSEADSERVMISFTIPPANTKLFPEWTGLAPGAVYCICFEATNPSGQSFSETVLRTNEPPTVGELTLSPSSGIVALTTPVTLSLGDGWTDMPDDLPFSIRFGLRQLLFDNTSIDVWEGPSTEAATTVYFASAGRSEVPCGMRGGYQGLVQVCDRRGACSRTVTAPFEVKHPRDPEEASRQLLELAESDIQSRDLYGALSKLDAIKLEHCHSGVAEEYSNRLVTAILDVFESDSDVDNFWDQLSWALSVDNRLSDAVTQQLYGALEMARLQSGLSAAKPRSKRQSGFEDNGTGSASGKEPRQYYAVAKDAKLISEEQAHQLMHPFDTLVAANKNIVAMYLQNILDVLSSFCRQVDPSRIMKATGSGLTFVQAQGVAPMTTDFLNSSYSFAGENRKMVSMTEGFKNVYSNYECGTREHPVVCMQICLGTAQIRHEALALNSHLQWFLFASPYKMIDFNHSVSNFYEVRFVDPVSGVFMTLPPAAAYRISVPLKTFRPSNYYACFVHLHGTWSDAACVSSNAKRITEDSFAVDCECTSTGIIGLFMVSPPTPPSYPPYNDILLTFTLTSSPTCSSADIAMFVSQVSTASDVSAKRFVKVMCTNDGQPTVTAVLRAPFRPDQTENSYAVQAIKRAVHASEGGLKVFSSSRAVSLEASVIQRVLSEDGYARRVTLTIDRSFRDVIGNDSATLVSRWVQSIASTTRVNIFRFKNPVVFVGIRFNFTITVPFEEEINPLSAAEIAQIILEDTQYSELLLEDRQGEPLPVEVATLADVTQLIPINETNTLALVLTIILSTFFVCSSTVIGFMVILKIRTDRLLNMRERVIDQARTIMAMPRQTSRVEDGFDGPGTSGLGANRISYHR